MGASSSHRSRRLFSAAGAIGLLAATTVPGGDADPAARVEAFSQPVTELPLSTPIAVEPGKKLFYVQCGVPACAEIAVGLEAAAEAAGWEYETASHQDTPDTVASAFDAAIAAEPDVVMTSGNPREWFAPQLATLEEMGMPVVAWSMPEAYEPGDGIDVNLLTNDDYYFYGVLMADYAAVNDDNAEHPVRRPPDVPGAVDRAARLRGRDRHGVPRLHGRGHRGRRHRSRHQPARHDRVGAAGQPRSRHDRLRLRRHAVRRARGDRGGRSRRPGRRRSRRPAAR